MSADRTPESARKTDVQVIREFLAVMAPTDDLPTPKQVELVLMALRDSTLRDVAERFASSPAEKHPNWPCATDGCPGDGRYAPPGRGHIAGCTGPIYPPGDPS